MPDDPLNWMALATPIIIFGGVWGVALLVGRFNSRLADKHLAKEAAKKQEAGDKCTR